jgi:hypothetical protein
MRRAIFTASLVLLTLGSFHPVAAQSGDHVLVLTYLCETYHDAIGGGFGVVPADCHYEGGITIIVTDQSGTVVAECTSSESDHPGWCSIQVPLGTTITITEDVSTVPAGYAPTRNPIVEETPRDGAPGEWIREFINVASGNVTLPSTGAGSVNHADRYRGKPLTALSAILLGAVAYMLRRSVRSSRSAG